jgi:hypothetical protein
MTQTKLHSFWESFQAAALAAPTAILLHKGTLMLAGNNALNGNQDIYVVSVWFMFFLHSIVWKFAIRRLNERYCVELNPSFIWNKLCWFCRKND